MNYLTIVFVIITAIIIAYLISENIYLGSQLRYIERRYHFLIEEITAIKRMLDDDGR